MSTHFRQSVDGSAPELQTQNQNVRPKPIPVPITGMASTTLDDSSSDSSASSVASVDTVRPSSREQQAPPTHWTSYFDQELYLDQQTAEHTTRFHVYLTPPSDFQKGPLFICHHGAGASGLSFATFAREVRRKLPAAGILSLEARGHGSVVTDSSTGREVVDFSLSSLVQDALAMIQLTAASQSWSSIPPCILVGHSLGGAITTTLASAHWKAFGPSLIGYAVLDVVEGSALEALGHMRTYLASRPSTFSSVDEAINWHIRTRTIRDRASAEASVPALLVPSPSGGENRTWKTDLRTTQPWWEEWFQGLSGKFLTGRGAKQLILAGTDRLDRELMIGQMQGKFQLVVVPEAGHFVQEDVPEKTAGLLVDFFRRNDRSQMVLPPKVSDLLAQGKKV